MRVSVIKQTVLAFLCLITLTGNLSDLNLDMYPAPAEKLSVTAIFI